MNYQDFELFADRRYRASRAASSTAMMTGVKIMAHTAQDSRVIE